MNRIGSYTLAGLIGQGGNGVVYRATHPVLHRPVAIKVLHDNVAHDPHLRARFLHEARVTLDLNHPGIVNVHDVDQDGARVFLVMEWFAHGSLAAALGRAPVPLLPGLDLLAQIADALAYAHRQGVVHGDIKPANILLRADGTPVVADFGLAVDRVVPAVGVAPDGQVRGTPAYLAPEQVRGYPPDQRSDLYAFGVTVYEVLSGQRPFGGTVEDLLARQQTAVSVALRDGDGPVPAALDELVVGLLAPDPAQRPAGMAVVAEQLRSIRGRVAASTAPVWVPPAPAAEPGVRARSGSRPEAPSGTVTEQVRTVDGPARDAAGTDPPVG